MAGLCRFLYLPVENETGVTVCGLWFMMKLLLQKTGDGCALLPWPCTRAIPPRPGMAVPLVTSSGPPGVKQTPTE